VLAHRAGEFRELRRETVRAAHPSVASKPSQ